MKRYTVDFTREARKQLRKMDMHVQKKIKDWLRNHLEGCENPRAYGKALTGNWAGYWRYRVSNYRIIADIQDDKIIIMITEIGHRKDVYRGA